MGFGSINIPKPPSLSGLSNLAGNLPSLPNISDILSGVTSNGLKGISPGTASSLGRFGSLPQLTGGLSKIKLPSISSLPSVNSILPTGIPTGTSVLSNNLQLQSNIIKNQSTNVINKLSSQIPTKLG